MQVISVRGGKVHTNNVFETAFPLCRTGSQSGGHTTYRTTDAPVTCATCLTFQPAPQPEPTPEAPKATRRPQLNHKGCDHAQTPLGRRTCRKAHWAAKAV